MEIISSKKVINGEEFNLVMNGSEIIRVGHDINEGYLEKHQIFKRCFSNNIPLTNNLTTNSFNCVKIILSPEVCQALISEQSSDNFDHKVAIQNLLPHILTQEVDEQIKSYFKTEYAITWYEFTEVSEENDEAYYYTKWH